MTWGIRKCTYGLVSLKYDDPATLISSSQELSITVELHARDYIRCKNENPINLSGLTDHPLKY